jgi:hypothetical protein
VKVNCAEPALAEIFEASPIRGGITLTDPATGVENALPVTLSRGEACVIDGVPFGRYRARFECRDTGLGIQPALPPGDVLEVTGDGSEITIDLDRCGALRIRAADDRAAATQSTDLRGVFASGAPHLNARGKWQSSDGSALIIRSWPHVIFPLPEGEYSVSIPRGVAPAGDHGGAHVVGVHVGRVTDFELTLASN